MAFPVRTTEVYDCGRVGGAAGAIQAGCDLVVPARADVGVYTLNLPAPGIPAANLLVSIQPCFDPAVGGVDYKATQVTYTSDTVITVELWRTSDGAPIDGAFNFWLEYVDGGAQDGAPGISFRGSPPA